MVRPAAVAVGLALLLVAGCGDDGGPPPAGLPYAISISGLVTFERFPVTGSGLAYGSPMMEPARRIEVQLRHPDGSLVRGTTAVTDSQGRYRLDALGSGQTYVVTAVARLRRGSRTEAEVVVDMAVVASGVPVVAGQDDLTLDIAIPSGWTGSGYDAATRHSGAFAILDTIHRVQDLVRTAEPGLAFPYVPVLWDQVGPDGPRSYYDPSSGLLVLTGVEDDDTDEFDQHVVAHEYAHYLLHRFARDDSLGGFHGPEDLLDETVAFSEGAATAIACIALDDPVYRDTNGIGQAATPIDDDIELGNGGSVATVPTGSLDPGSVPDIPIAGSHNEISVAAILWDIHDDSGASEAHDSVARGFAPIWSALRGELAGTEAFTTVLPVLRAFAGDAGVAQLALYENVSASDDYEDAQLAIGPRYLEVVVDAADPSDTDAAGRPLELHEVADFTRSGAPVEKVENLYNWQYVRATPDGQGAYVITVQPAAGVDTVVSSERFLYQDTVDNGGGATDTIFLDDHPDAAGEIVFRVGSGSATGAFTVQITGPPGG